MENDKFIILDLESLTLVTDEEGNTHTFETKEEAEIYCQNLVFYYSIIEV